MIPVNRYIVYTSIVFKKVISRFPFLLLKTIASSGKAGGAPRAFPRYFPGGFNNGIVGESVPTCLSELVFGREMS
jgi:hypothetical protein